MHSALKRSKIAALSGLFCRRVLMGELLGIGISHYPGFIFADAEMSMRVKSTITSPKVPEHLKDPKNWPAPMQEEWADDEGSAFATKHRNQFVDGVRIARKALDDFAPDVVVIFGDDQYENFKEDIIPPFCVSISDEYQTQPHLRSFPRPQRPNVWEEPYDKTFVTPGHRQVAKHLVTKLMEEGFDVPYSYKDLHLEGLGARLHQHRHVPRLRPHRLGLPHRAVPDQRLRPQRRERQGRSAAACSPKRTSSTTRPRLRRSAASTSASRSRRCSRRARGARRSSGRPAGRTLS